MSGAPLRVLHIVDSLGMGGAETWIMALLRRWARTGNVELELLLTGGHGQLFDDEARALGAKLHTIPFHRSGLGQFGAGLHRLLREGHYDAIHDHADLAGGWHMLLGIGSLPPVRVAHVHNPWLLSNANYAVSPARRVTRRLGRELIGRLATHICGTSAEVLGNYGFEVGRSGRPSVSVAHCGIEVERFSGPREPDRGTVLAEFGWPAETKLVLFVGRLDRAMEFDHPQNHKNSWFAINVARVAFVKDPSVRLIMVGAGEAQRSALEGRVREWGCADSLRLVGLRHDVPSLMRAADSLLFPSRQEGLGMVAVEAQATGLPVLASTAVPREGVVVPAICRALALDASLDIWSAALLESLQAPRLPIAQCREAVETSAFSIARSAAQLEMIYASGRR